MLPAARRLGQRGFAHAAKTVNSDTALLAQFAGQFVQLHTASNERIAIGAGKRIATGAAKIGALPRRTAQVDIARRGLPHQGLIMCCVVLRQQLELERFLQIDWLERCVVAELAQRVIRAHRLHRAVERHTNTAPGQQCRVEALGKHARRQIEHGIRGIYGNDMCYPGGKQRFGQRGGMAGAQECQAARLLAEEGAQFVGVHRAHRANLVFQRQRRHIGGQAAVAGEVQQVERHGIGAEDMAQAIGGRQPQMDIERHRCVHVLAGLYDCIDFALHIEQRHRRNAACATVDERRGEQRQHPHRRGT